MNSSKSASFRLEDGRMSGVNDKKLQSWPSGYYGLSNRLMQLDEVEERRWLV